MKPRVSSLPLHFAALVIAALPLVFAGCTAMDRSGSGRDDARATFAHVRPVLESKCVHCHGEQRLPQMPAFNDTEALSRLIGANNWIVPGHPERSRFFQVVTFSDQQPGAMPPTGHAIAKAEVDALRVWIVAGAPLPEGAPVELRPKGEAPRSR